MLRQRHAVTLGGGRAVERRRAPRPKQYTIGYSNGGGVGNGFREEQVCTAKAQAKASGEVSNLTVIHRNTDAAGQLSDIRDLIAKGVNAIVFNPNDPDALNPALAEAKAAGIVTVSVDAYVTDPNTWNLYNNQVKYAELGAKWLFDQMGGTGTVWYTRGLAGHPADSDRDIGFQTILKQYPNIKVVPSNSGVFTGWDPATTTNLTNDFIPSGQYDKIQGIWASGMGKQIVDAIKAANKPFVPIADADIGGFVTQLLDPTNFPGLKGAAVTNTAAVGGAGITMALKLLKGETITAVRRRPAEHDPAGPGPARQHDRRRQDGAQGLAVGPGSRPAVAARPRPSRTGPRTIRTRFRHLQGRVAATALAAHAGDAGRPASLAHPTRGTMTVTTDLLLEATGVSKTYGAVVALKSASLAVRPGEVHALLGANGAGKSTFVKILTGVVHPDTGRIVVRGKERTAHSPAEARRGGLVSVYQEPSLIPDLDIRANLRLTNTPLEPFRHWLRELGLADLDLSSMARRVPLASLRIIDLARALAIEPDVLMLDEMTAALPANLTERVLEVLGSHRGGDRSVIFISHRLIEIAAVCDRATVLREGETVGVVDVTPGLRGEDRRAHARPERRRDARGRRATAAHRAAATTPRLSVRSLASGTKLQDASFELYPGEVLGVVALEGQGQDELFDILAGSERPSGGELLVDGRRPRSGILPTRSGPVWSTSLPTVPRRS